MNRLASSPLLAICATATLALTSLSLLNPNGIYTDYIDALPAGTPAIAAVFTAAQDGVFPFALPGGAVSSADAAYSPQYRPLTETVTDEEMYSSVGDSAPFEEEKKEEPPAAEPFGAAEASREAEAPAEPPAEEFFAVESDWFDDAVFIGDSHTEGFCDYAGVPNATYYFKRGLSVWTVMEKAVAEGKQTIPQVLSQRRFGKIYLLLGINEIGSGTVESFAAQYAAVVAQLRELQPDALIYIQAIFHTSQSKSSTSIYNNERINERNAALARLADGVHVVFLDCNEVFDDETGALKAEYTGDGVHVMAPYYALWRDFLLLHGHALPEASDAAN